LLLYRDVFFYLLLGVGLVLVDRPQLRDLALSGDLGQVVGERHALPGTLSSHQLQYNVGVYCIDHIFLKLGERRSWKGYYSSS
jgi:hypothetical protein